MTPSGPGLRAIIRINVQLLFGTGFAGASWLAWQNVSVLWWQLALVAPLCAVTAFAAFISALGEIKSLVMRDLRVNAYRRQGAVPKSDRLVSSKAMRDEGLIK